MAKQKRVLVVEDERPLANVLKLKLEHDGIETVIAQNGKQCMDALASGHFDVILLDMLMPVMNGFQVLDEISKMADKPVVFALSNLSVTDDQSKVLAMGAKKYFIKSDTPLAVILDEIKNA